MKSTILHDLDSIKGNLYTYIYSALAIVTLSWVSAIPSVTKETRDSRSESEQFELGSFLKILVQSLSSKLS